MSINLIVIIISVLLFILIAVFYRNTTLDKLQFLSGEKIVYEESGVRVEQSGSPRSVIFINCIVRVTDKRIIIAQKMLLSKQYALRHVILYNGLYGITNLGTSLKKGYLNIVISKADINIGEKGGACTVRINIPESVLTKNQYISYKTGGMDYYSGIIRA